MGKSGLIGQKIAATMASTGTPSFFLHPAEGLHGDLGMLARRDVLIAISNSGETQEILQLLPFMERMGIPVVAVVGRKNSTLAKNSAVALDVSVEEEACPMGLAPTASTTASGLASLMLHTIHDSRYNGSVRRPTSAATVVRERSSRVASSTRESGPSSRR